jgi:hypothetical protein
VGAGAGTGGGDTIIQIAWQTFSGEPSVKEVERVAGMIKPALDRMKGNKVRSSF